MDGKDRPTARGHRFGPDLTCSECGLSWEEHQASPGPCKKVPGPEPSVAADLAAPIAILEPSADPDDSSKLKFGVDSEEEDPLLK